MIAEVELLPGLLLVVTLYDREPHEDPSVDAWRLVRVGDNELDRRDVTDEARDDFKFLIDEELTRRGIEAFGLLAQIRSAAEAAREASWGL